MTFDPALVRSIERLSSPNRGNRDGWPPDMICCHQSGSRLGTCTDWFLNPDSGISTHFGVTRRGKIYQYVPVNDAAFANATRYRPGEEILSNHYLRSLNRIVRERKTNANFYTLSIEFEALGSGYLSRTQYEAGLELMKYLITLCRKRYGVEFPVDREHIIGHYECSPVEKAACPGLDFPFARFVADLAEADRQGRTRKIREESSVLSVSF